MSDDLFAGFDISDATEDPFRIGPGVHDVTISKVTTTQPKNDAAIGSFVMDGAKSKEQGVRLIVEYSNDEGQKVSEFLSIPHKDNSDKWNKNSLYFFNQFFSSLEIPAARMNEVAGNPEKHLVGMELTITCKQNGQYVNVVKRQVASGVEMDSASSNLFG